MAKKPTPQDPLSGLKYYESLNNKALPSEEVQAEKAYRAHQEYLNRRPTSTTTKTQYIKFDKKELEDWFNKMSTSVDYDCIRIYLGVYPDNDVPEDHQDWKDKLTVFLIPYKGLRHATFTSPTGSSEDDLPPAFNMGEIYP